MLFRKELLGQLDVDRLVRKSLANSYKLMRKMRNIASYAKNYHSGLGNRQSKINQLFNKIKMNEGHTLHEQLLPLQFSELIRARGP